MNTANLNNWWLIVILLLFDNVKCLTYKLKLICTHWYYDVVIFDTENREYSIINHFVDIGKNIDIEKTCKNVNVTFFVILLQHVCVPKKGLFGE